MFMNAIRLGIIGLAVIMISVSSSFAADDIRLQGAGATFPNPLYQRWVSEYQKTHPNVKIDYQSIGSGGGIKAITEKTVHFAGSDAPLNKKEIETLGGNDNIIQIPSCAGAVVPAYNVPGVTGTINFTGELLAEIFSGKISKWNDAKIVALNPDAKLPNLIITPAYRSDGSGTTYVFTNYLATQSETFKNNIGTGKQVQWPIGQGGKGNEGVAAAVQGSSGTIGYIELNYAIANKITYGTVKNQSGKFIKATTASVSAAGEGAASSLSGTVLSANIWNQSGSDAYPIASFTYLIVYKDLNTAKTNTEAKVLSDFLIWSVNAGQKIATEMDYAPLSMSVQVKVNEALKQVNYKGNPIK